MILAEEKEERERKKKEREEPEVQMVTQRKARSVSCTLCIEYTKIHRKFIFVVWKPYLMLKVETATTDAAFCMIHFNIIFSTCTS